MMPDFREPFFLDILETGWRSDVEADEEDVCLGVGEGTETVVVFLACCVEEA